jgi:hypothetical protein
MNTNLAKVIALAIVCGVAKALFQTPRPPGPPTFNYNYNGPENMADSELSKQIEADKNSLSAVPDPKED